MVHLLIMQNLSKTYNGSALKGEKTASMDIYHATTSGTFN